MSIYDRVCGGGEGLVSCQNSPWGETHQKVTNVTFEDKCVGALVAGSPDLNCNRLLTEEQISYRWCRTTCRTCELVGSVRTSLYLDGAGKIISVFHVIGCLRGKEGGWGYVRCLPLGAHSKLDLISRKREPRMERNWGPGRLGPQGQLSMSQIKRECASVGPGWGQLPVSPVHWEEMEALTPRTIMLYICWFTCQERVALGACVCGHASRWACAWWMLVPREEASVPQQIGRQYSSKEWGKPHQWFVIAGDISAACRPSVYPSSAWWHLYFFFSPD